MNQNTNQSNNNQYMNPNANKDNNNPYTSSIGNMNQNIAAVLAYASIVFIRWTGLFYLSFLGPLLFVILEKKNMFVKKHAGQALVLSVIEMIIGAVNMFTGYNILRFVKFDTVNGLMGLEAVSGAYMIIAGISAIISLVLFVFTVIAIIKAYNNKEYEIPVIGQIAKAIIK